ncbi:ABC transporter ATP-binding protein [Streptomyces poonensis]|uniref:ABC transporter ATP-binding protein n=1 Tax=Streptomyces poonensis TaxID=68255 RepID=UPI00167B5C4F|nr:ABC transporter ATP-binding protein [Streptomyces poonensis]
MIQAIGLTSASRKKIPPVVDNVSFEARSGRVTALLGASGAGKTTSLRLMLGLQQGRGITYFGGRPLHRIAQPSREIGVVLGDVPGHPARTVRGHLRMLCAAVGVPVRRADEVLDVVGLAGLRDVRLGTLSRGMDRRLGLACAFLADPPALVLDAPADGLSVRESRWLHGMLRAHAAQGGAVLFTTRDPKQAAQAADQVVTLDRGRLVADQEVTEFARTRLRPRVAVRSPHAARLAAMLTKEARSARRSVEVVREDGNRLSVYGSTCADVGETAFRHGILVHRLADETGDMGVRPDVGVQAPPTIDTPTRNGNPQAPDATSQAPDTTPQAPSAGARTSEPGPPYGEDDAEHRTEAAPREAEAALHQAKAALHRAEAAPHQAEAATPRPGAAAHRSRLAVHHRGPTADPPGPTADPPEPTPDLPYPSANRPAPFARRAAPAAPHGSAPAAPHPAAPKPPGHSLPLPPPITVRTGRSPARPLRYELRRAAGIGTGYLTAVTVLITSALLALVLARIGHTPQPRLLAAWPRELPLPPAALGAGLLGALAFGDEFRHPALAADRGTVPRRLGLLGAKLLVAAVTALLLAVLTVGCDLELLHLVYGPEVAGVPADWTSAAVSWAGLVVGCSWAGVLAAGVFRSTSAGLAAVIAVPVLVVPLVHRFLEGAHVRSAAGLPLRLRELPLLRWVSGGEEHLAAAGRVIAQPVGGALLLSLATLLCAYLVTTLRSRAG